MITVEFFWTLINRSIVFELHARNFELLKIRTKNNDLTKFRFHPIVHVRFTCRKICVRKIEFSQSPISRDLVNRQLISVQLIPYNKTEAHTHTHTQKKNTKPLRKKKKSKKSANFYECSKLFSRLDFQQNSRGSTVKFLVRSIFDVRAPLTRFVKRIKEQLVGRGMKGKQFFHISWNIYYEKIKYNTNLTIGYWHRSIDPERIFSFFFFFFFFFHRQTLTY